MDTGNSHQGHRRTKVNAEETSYRRNRGDLIKLAEMPNQQQQSEAPHTYTIGPVQVPTSPEKVSSRGRSIRPPVWLKDYSTNYKENIFQEVGDITSVNSIISPVVH